MTDAQRRAARTLARSAFYTRTYLEALHAEAVRYAEMLCLEPKTVEDLESALTAVRALEQGHGGLFTVRYGDYRP